MYELLGLLWKHLFCRNLCVLCWLWKSILSLGCHILHFVLAVLHVWVEGSTCHFPRESWADFFCSTTFFVCSCACLQLTIFILPLHLPAPFSSSSFSSWSFPLPLTAATTATLSPCLPLCCVCLVSFSFILQKFPHSHSKRIGQSSLLLPLCCFVGLTPELCCLGSYPTVFSSFLSFSTVLDHSSKCWAASISYSFASLRSITCVFSSWLPCTWCYQQHTQLLLISFPS